jgi:transcriptional regulator with XRE-family HTH domain
VTEAQSGAGGGPTVRRMLVGAQLRRLRTEAGLSREEAGEAIRASEWKLHRLENGQVGFKERDVVDLLRLYGVTDPGEVAALVELAHQANQPGWWQPYGDLHVMESISVRSQPPDKTAEILAKIVKEEKR